MALKMFFLFRALEIMYISAKSNVDIHVHVWLNMTQITLFIQLQNIERAREKDFYMYNNWTWHFNIYLESQVSCVHQSLLFHQELWGPFQFLCGGEREFYIVV